MRVRRSHAEGKQHTSWRLASVFAVVLAVAAAGCGSDDESGAEGGGAAAASTPIKVVSLASLVTLQPFKHAVETGAYEKAGLEVEDITVGSGSDGAKLFLGGQVDMAVTAAVHSFLGQAQGRDVKIVQTLTTNSSLEMLTRKDLNIAAGDWEALKGRKCGATGPGSDTDLLLRAVLESHGVQPDEDVTFVYTGGVGEAIAGFKTGRIDCFLALPGMRAQVLEEGSAVSFYDLADDPELGKGPSIALAVQGDFLRENEDAVRKFVETTLNEVELFYDDPQATRESIPAIYAELDPEAVMTEFERFRDVEAFPPDGRQDEAAFETAIEVYTAAEALPSAPTFEEVYDDRFLPPAGG